MITGIDDGCYHCTVHDDHIMYCSSVLPTFIVDEIMLFMFWAKERKVAWMLLDARVV